MRISEFCGLTIKDIDLGNRIVNIDHQLQRLSDMTLVIEPTKTSAGTRKLPVTEDVAKCFQAIIEDREKPEVEKVVDGYTGFLFLDDKRLPLVAMHWEHRFNHMVKRLEDLQNAEKNWNGRKERSLCHRRCLKQYRRIVSLEALWR